MCAHSARRLTLALSATFISALAGCSPDSTPTAPARSAEPDLVRSAFLLTIDVGSGRITVGRPAARTVNAEGPQLSLLGSEAVALEATACTWSAASKSKQKRCTFDLTIRNQLASTDLMAPTTFPQPPQGSTGILVFPYVAAALGVPGGGAVPTDDWDNAPANFFDDFGGCGGKSSGCYRSETYPGPLYGGAASAPRTVGFDVDKNSHSVSVYVVVAADLRENPLQTVRLSASDEACGYLTELGDQIVLGTASDIRFGDDLNTGTSGRGFCSFALPASTIHVEAAMLEVHQTMVLSTPYQNAAAVVDHLDIGSTLDISDWDRGSISAAFGTISSDATLGRKALDVTDAVKFDVAFSRTNTQFRFRFPIVVKGVAVFAGPNQANAPELVLSYRNP